jgi:curved DNA-binding protein CbpA
MPATLTDHYTVLGVQRLADRRTIQAAYRALARGAHPDFGGDDSSMARINEAWRVLGDSTRRAEYDAAHGYPGPGASGDSSTARPTRAHKTAERGVRGGSTVLDFGRYEGWTIRDVANTDDDYLQWLQRTSLGRPLRAEIAKALEERESAMESIRTAARTSAAAAAARQPKRGRWRLR